MDVYEQLRKVFDGADSFVAGGHAVGGAGRTRHNERVTNTPDWVHSDVEVRLLLLRVFPKLDSDERQRRHAATWMLVIHYYFRMGLTQGRIAMKTGWTPKKVNNMILSIQYAASGRTAHGELRRGKRGRPKKNNNTESL